MTKFLNRIFLILGSLFLIMIIPSILLRECLREDLIIKEFSQYKFVLDDQFYLELYHNGIELPKSKAFEVYEWFLNERPDIKFLYMNIYNKDKAFEYQVYYREHIKDPKFNISHREYY